MIGTDWILVIGFGMVFCAIWWLGDLVRDATKRLDQLIVLIDRLPH